MDYVFEWLGKSNKDFKQSWDITLTNIEVYEDQQMPSLRYIVFYCMIKLSL